MSNEPTSKALVGSDREPLDGARPTGRLDPSSTFEVTVYLRPREQISRAADSDFLSREELADVRGAEPSAMDAVERFAAERGIAVVERDQPGRRVRLRGSAAAMADAFGIELQHYEHPGGTYRGHTGPVLLPEELHDSIVAVLGLDDRPQARAHLRHAGSDAVSYTPNVVGAAYGVSSGATAAGVCVALIELGGGFSTIDISTYFDSLGIPSPTVEAIPVDGGSNRPSGGPSGPDAEVMLDIEVVGAVASGVSLAVYFGPNTDQGFADAISAAVHDATRKPAVISISWGGPEDSYTKQAIAAFEAALTDAALSGTTVFVASGDNGSSDGATDKLAHVDYPASSPQVVGCGGTHLQLTNGVISSEVVWDDLPNGGATGGGVSTNFPVPSWQADANVPSSKDPGVGQGRGVPDVSADADPQTGYQIRVDGESTVVGGTSAVAPLYAALAALAVGQAGGPLGFVNAMLYGLGDEGFRDIIAGTNGAYSAKRGWDPCTGLGSPKAAALIEALASSRKS